MSLHKTNNEGSPLNIQVNLSRIEHEQIWQQKKKKQELDARENGYRLNNAIK